MQRGILSTSLSIQAERKGECMIIERELMANEKTSTERKKMDGEPMKAED